MCHKSYSVASLRDFLAPQGPVPVAAAYLYCRVRASRHRFGRPLVAPQYSVHSVKKPTNPYARRADIIPLKDGLAALVQAYRLGGKLDEVTVVSSWERVMGKAVALKTQEVFVKQGKLFVRLTSAPLKHELVMAKTRVAEMINEAVGHVVIQEVIFL